MDSAENCWEYFIDKEGRVRILRGVNVGGDDKTPTGHMTHMGAEERPGNLQGEGIEHVTFVGRPFPLEDADEHLQRLQD